MIGLRDRVITGVAGDHSTGAIADDNQPEIGRKVRTASKD
jgi:hypothetical protein